MGRIITLKNINEEKIIINLESNQRHMINLKGNLEKIHIFSRNAFDITTRLVQRGRKESTKYLLIPKEFRKILMPSDSIKCQNIETKTKHLIIFEVPK